MRSKLTTHQMFLGSSTVVGVILLALLYYLIILLLQEPQGVVEIAQGIIVFDGIVFGFQALIFQDQLEDIFSFVKSIKNPPKKQALAEPLIKPQQNIFQTLLAGAFNQNVMHLYVTLLALIMLLFSSILSVIALIGSAMALIISLVLTYVSTYGLIVLLLNMVFIRIKTGYDIIGRT